MAFSAYDASGVEYDPSIAYCTEGCGQLASFESLAGMTADGTEIVDLVCFDHSSAEARLVGFFPIAED